MRRDKPEEWKCQPHHWLSPELERHEILVGSFSLFIGSALSAALAAYVINGGPSTVYYNVTDCGWIWYILSWPACFIWQVILIIMSNVEAPYSESSALAFTLDPLLRQCWGHIFWRLPVRG